VFAGAGGLGAELYSDLAFKTGIVVCGTIAIGMAIGFGYSAIATISALAMLVIPRIPHLGKKLERSEE